jgi:RIO-like serine/threonine protein kinase
MGRRIKLREEQLIGRGFKTGDVYAVGNIAVKVYRRSRYSPLAELDMMRHDGQNARRRANDEYAVTKDMYDAGIRVPKQYGVFRVEIDGTKALGLAMEMINGRRLSELHGKEYLSKEEEMALEAEKAVKLGFYICNDRHDDNAMVRERDGKVVLIDLEDCESPSKRLEEVA